MSHFTGLVMSPASTLCRNVTKVSPGIFLSYHTSFYVCVLNFTHDETNTLDSLHENFPLCTGWGVPANLEQN